ncbi:PRC-barrel domain-containing protein [Pontibacter mangrovi]|uniref:PRC-barrel domain-containing protein n=1 Tax=Pontibacter mangrovi TaxID=2589816 RepID=A0A501WGS4_9BACT|nr:PRC-barrel domain-containing protein [Pontibacter mangrovi]TPE46217.1 hypothetical protein FJM65_02425 [Pontibacter mangrovi]
MKNEDFRNERLVPLSAMHDYQIAKDNPDVLGWRVVGADGESLGMVKDLIVDPKLMKARYLSVVGDRRFFNTENDPYMLIPIGLAALDKKGKKVFVPTVDSNTIGQYPIYNGGPVTEDYEYAVRDSVNRFQRNAMPGTSEEHKAEFEEALHRQPEHRHLSEDFYNDASFDENRFYTSDQDVYREKVYSSRDYSKDEDQLSAADMHQEERRPKSVEDSISTIERLEHLRERGSITEEEFILLKKRALDL